MNSDATEAALGLLGLSPLNAPPSQPQPNSSTIGGITTIDRISNGLRNSPALPPSLVPLKRKQPSPTMSTGGISPTMATTNAAPNTWSESSPVESTSTQGLNLLASSSTPPPTSMALLQNVQTSSKSATQRRHQQVYSPHLMTSLPPSTPPPLVSPSPSPHPLSLPPQRHSPSRQYEQPPPPPVDSDAISCICGLAYDDGFSIACDDCSRWCHAACFGIVEGGDVPEEWRCWVCDPELGRKVDRERAVKVQKGRVRALKSRGGGVGGIGAAEIGANGSAGVSSGAGEGAIASTAKPVSRRKTSPGAERKQRRGSTIATAVESTGSVSSKKRRRVSMLASASTQPVDPSSSSHTLSRPSHASSARISHPPASAHPRADMVDNNSVPDQATGTSASPTVFPPDSYPHPSTHAHLLRVARAWRGVTALNPPSQLNPPRTYVDGQGGWTRVDGQGYTDRYGHSMSPLDSTTPVMLDGAVEDVVLPRTVLKTDVASASSHLEPSPSSYSYAAPSLLRPPSPHLYVASSPLPRPHPTPACNPKPPDPSNLKGAQTIPAATLLAPYTASIAPSSAYLADPLNGYAHLGMGKPQVRLVGGGWGVGVDARHVGFGSESRGNDKERASAAGSKPDEESVGKTRWARCGCWPNVVLRPVICGGSKRRSRKNENAEGKGWRRKHRAGCVNSESAESANMDEGAKTNHAENDKDHSFSSNPSNISQDSPDSDSTSDSDTDSTTLSFALFALRDLRADEEIVLGWEWDDGHAVHMLPALMESPGMFGSAHLGHLRAQFTSILHALSSTFTTCACGSTTRDCAVRVMERVVEGRWPWPGGEMSTSGSDCDSESMLDSDCTSSEGCGDMDTSESNIRGRKQKRRKSHVKRKQAVDLGPLVGVKRGFRTREKAPMSGGWCGVEVVPSSLAASPEVKKDEVNDKSGKMKGDKREKSKKGNGEAEGCAMDHHTDREGVGSRNGSSTTGASTSGAVKDHDTVAGAFVDGFSVQNVLPPRMRKPWMQLPASRQPSRVQRQPYAEQYAQPGHNESTEKAETWSWRSSQPMDVDSPLSPSVVTVQRSGKHEQKGSGVVVAGSEGSGDKGLDGQETEFDTETEGEGTEDAHQMPPPPMPAALDPTTVSSRTRALGKSASPRPAAMKNGSLHAPAASRTPTSSSAALRKTSHVIGPTNSLPVHALKDSSGPTPPTDQSLASSPTIPSALPYLPSQPHAPVQSQPPIASPSTPFSKLSLFSPDVTLSSAQTSALLGSDSGSLDTQAHQDARPSSVPHHGPSKPLHVHPQNSAEMTSNPLSPKLERHLDMSSETNGTTRADSYRVRFASPEVLSGLPSLNVRVGNSSRISTEDVDIDVDVVGESNFGEDPPLIPSRMDVENEAMDVDQDHNEEEVIDVVGDDPGSNVPGTDVGTVSLLERHSPPAAKGGLLDEQRPPVPPASPHPALSYSHDSVLPVSIQAGVLPSGTTADTPTDEPPGIIQVPDSTPHSPPRPTIYQPQPEPEVQPPQSREASPVPPPKVKMSLKDFALRKKKQREEKMAARTVTSSASPNSVAGSLPSPNVIERELVGESGGSIGTSKVEGTDDDAPDHREQGPVTSSDSQEVIEVAPETATNATNVEEGSKGEVNTFERAGAPSVCPQANEDSKMASGDLPTQPAAPVEEACPPSQPLVASPPASYRTAFETRIDDWTHEAPVTLKAKVEMMEDMMPSGLVGTDERAHDVVSFAPDPPPPPLTNKQLKDADVGENSKAIPSTSTSLTTSSTGSRSASMPTSSTPNHSTPHLHHNPASLPPQPSSSLPLSRRNSTSREDGEISVTTAPKTYTPRSHTPPTQPRSFNTSYPTSSSLTTSSIAPSVPRRPPQPPPSRPSSSNATGPGPNPSVAANGLSRPLPSGPRALRGSTSQPTYPLAYAPSNRTHVGSQYIPRGPSADRDRMDWDRDRPWIAPSRSRGRAGSNGWGR